MSANRIDMVFHEPLNVLRDVPDAYRIEPTGRWRYFHRAAWWLLRKTGAVTKHQEWATEYRRVSFDTDRAMERIFKARSHLFMGRRERPAKVLIGAEDMAELMQDAAFTDAAQYGRGISFTSHMWFNREVFGLPVAVVPHMRGVLVL